MGAKRYDKCMKIIGADSAVSRIKVLLFLVVLLPFLPSDLMCLVVGVTPISFKSYIIIVIICRPWGQFAAALLGGSSLHIPVGVLLPVIAAMIVVCVLAVRFAPGIERFVFKWVHKLTDRFSKGK
jgi:uncharacterized membrane protein YdjX (TVP38/TMEM64 family)